MWSSLPTEMKLAVVEVLDLDDVKSLSQVDRDTYTSCLPSSFKNVKLNNLQALQSFVDNVPRSYCRYVHCLDLCTESNARSSDPRSITEVVISILAASPCLEELVLRTGGSLHHSIISCFGHLSKLERLSIHNSGPEDRKPLSERLVVAIAASVPNLKRLSLDRVSRSLMHAPELHGVPPYIPLVTGDDNIPDHPRLGADLYLPSLLQLPTLRELVIRDTHLGDRRWATVPVKCKLQVVDLGSCFHENEDFNSICIQRIMGAVGKTVDEFSLTTTVSDIVFAKPSVTPLQRLRKLHISPFFPVDSVVDTITNLAGSPIENLSMQCYEDDVVDVCVALEEFLNRRVERGVGFYEKLARIDVSVTSNDASSPLGPDEVAECKEAEQRLKELCCDLRLASRFSRTIPPSAASRLARSTGLVMTRLPAPGDGRVRSMTL
ncbi:hypothetical protein EV368DRAFT_85197 [Lentinula lateritia]|uniref:Uncharacterized protein n=1 Tax=Lentinula aff. lateritia TaxID=2804960 RepID=A0ACC1U9D5_9AGAR|nr:hypothetical protein F5876DRAFT_73759 [Lentinula aff. lateritia]KAJ3849766.1 hypothetical protein EV368DRAFT_85197 [Lentinula lateritia]